MVRKYLLFVFILMLLLSGCGEVSHLDQPEPKTDDVVSETVDENTMESEVDHDEKADLEKFIPATVVRVVDGDTLNVRLENGTEEKVRLLLVDTPETVHPNKPEQPFGKDASNFAKQLMPEGSTVHIELDVGESDKYGRLLAYIWVNDKMVNELLLEKGLARVAYVYAPNTKYVDRFYEVQQRAQQQEIGIWSIENYATDQGFQPEVVEQEQPEQQVTTNCENPTIKGNHSSSGELIYHVPGGQFYEQTKAEEMFCTEEDAIAAGYRKSKR